jgi:hypothetical protein
MIDKVKYYLNLGIQNFTIDDYEFEIIRDNKSKMPYYAFKVGDIDNDVKLFLRSLLDKYDVVKCVKNA